MNFSISVSQIQKMKVSMKKEARIDPNAIIKEKRCLNIVAKDYVLLKQLVEHCGDNITADISNVICTSKPSLNKAEKRKAKKKKHGQSKGKKEEIKMDDFVPVVIKPEDIILCTILPIEEPTLKNGLEEFLFKEAPPVDNFAIYGYDSPDHITNNGLYWKNGTRIPPVLNNFQRVVFGLFGIGTKTSATVLQKFNITLFPPSTDKSVITTLYKTDDSTMARVILILGSPENILFHAEQKKIEADCDVSFFKDQAIMLAYGICNTISLTFNNAESYVHKMKPNTRGINRDKTPSKRWVIVIDYISDENTLNREFKNAIREATKKNPAKAALLRNSNFLTDTDRVAEMACKKEIQTAIESPSKKEIPLLIPDDDSLFKLNIMNNHLL